MPSYRLETRENPYSCAMYELHTPDRPAMTVSDSHPQPAPGRSSPMRHTLASVVVPIRSLGENHRGRILAHLLALTPDDRYFRFGFAINDAQIQAYVQGLKFDRDEVFGVYNRHLALIAMAHLAYASDLRLNACAEFGVSVLAHARGRGYGTRLFERAMVHARNRGVRMLFVHALSENTAMLKIARHAGAVVQRDGADCEALLELPPATLDSHLSEWVTEQTAQADYQLKLQARQFADFMGHVQRAWMLPGTAASAPDPTDATPPVARMAQPKRSCRSGGSANPSAR